MAIYVQIGAKDEIKGNVTAKGHEHWIECGSLQFGVGRAISMPVGRSTDREASLPSLSEVTLTKQMEDSSPYIFQEALRGEGKTVTIHITKTGKDQAENIVEYILTNTMISGYSISTGGDAPTESFSLSYTKIEMKYIMWDAAHKKASQVPVSYDLATATGS
ncbi:MAG: type VI secretion system tube protein Hcp [Planctomycetes bacterium]|nr:type VI secretion system tube protein Hcp [Planctomycetota bacterium]